MLYLLRIQFTKPEWARKSDFYYAILGAILNLFEDQGAVYTSILKLSFSVGEQLEINMGIQGEEWYNMIVSHLLSHPEQELSINGSKCSLKQINLISLMGRWGNIGILINLYWDFILLLL